MSYISEIFERANFQQLGSFLLYGVSSQPNCNSYEKRIREATDTLFSIAHTELAEDQDKMEDALIGAVTCCEEVSMELGLQAGMQLAMQIYNPER